MKILAIETSCDETAIALIDCQGGLKRPQFKVLKNIVSSQIAVHRPFGGVVPNLAKREHIKNLPKIFKKLQASGFKLQDVDAIAVTVGPGLEPALWQGIEFAENLSKELDKPLIGANHMEGHLYSNWLSQSVIATSASGIARERPKQSHKNLGKIATSDRGRIRNDSIKFPAVALVVSGGHTILLKMDTLTKWKKLGETRDDAAGEAFDKIARLIGLPYPGGPEIQKIAKKGNSKAFNFPRPMLKDQNYEFSFSGLKTSVLYYLRDNPDANRADVAASVQQAIVDVLVVKTIRAAKNFGAESVLLCGGVSANKLLQETLKEESERLNKKFFVPSFEFNTDNAAMIAAAAYIQHLRKKKLKIEANSNLNL